MGLNSMKAFLLSALVLLVLAGHAAAADTATNVFESPAPPQPAGEIDRLVFAKLSSLGIRPVGCSDAVFVRRAYLDVIGTLPTAEEAREFLQDPDKKNKRNALIDRLLARNEFAVYWAMKWSDILRIKAEFPVNLWPNAAQAYHRWVLASLSANKPYDQLVREMLTSSGSNFRVGPVNFYRAVQSKTPETIASAVALTLMGTRTDAWNPDRLQGMAVFFSQIGFKPTSEWKEEIVFWDPLQASRVPTSIAPGRDAVIAVVRGPSAEPAAEPATKPATASVTPAEAGPLTAVFPDGTKVQIPPDQDPREVFADWLITAENPWFARCIVNRVWAWLLGRGIIHEPDDIREDNPPSNPALLAYLEKEFVAGGYDLQRLYRLILNSRTYQLSSTPRFNTPAADANFASYPIRRLEAEVLIDAVNQITGTSDFYTSPIPEPFTNIPRDVRAIAIADGSISSSFLTLFGRSARATGMENERDNKPVPAQWLHMLNSSQIQQKLEQSPKLRELLAAHARSPRELVEQLYLTVLSRQPTAQEMRLALEYNSSSAAPTRTGGWKQRSDWLDIAWALINNTEFLYRH
ncbi:MAG: DUF1553 domain-containing protein [Candidatus Anammoximicrobium sp.]|nr:DUF1553 domain-containing protein [Candidatus Anammoximicrobium sp.]